MNQWGLIRSGCIELIDERKGKIQHLISTMPGQSGAPMILINDDKLSIIGIHKGAVK